MTRLRLTLTTATTVRRTLARIANMVMNDEIDTRKANAIVGICNAVLNSIRTDEQQMKIDALDNLLSNIVKDGEIYEDDR